MDKKNYTKEELAKIDADLEELANILFEKWLGERNAERAKAKQSPQKPVAQ